MRIVGGLRDSDVCEKGMEFAISCFHLAIEERDGEIRMDYHVRYVIRSICYAVCKVKLVLPVDCASVVRCFRLVSSVLLSFEWLFFPNFVSYVGSRSSVCLVWSIRAEEQMHEL